MVEPCPVHDGTMRRAAGTGPRDVFRVAVRGPQSDYGGQCAGRDEWRTEGSRRADAEVPRASAPVTPVDGAALWEVSSMTEEHPERVGGKGFAPSERNVDEQDDAEATTVHGGGKQFAKDVGDPDSDESARQTEGSGKRFAWETEEDEAGSGDVPGRGSGKQFRPGGRDQG